MNKKLFINITLSIVALLFMAGCNKSDIDNNPITPEEPVEQGAKFFGGMESKSSTRTSLSASLPYGSTVNYFWEQGDNIWLADGSKSKTPVKAKANKALFHFEKAYTTPTLQIYYPGQNATAYNQVTIATQQTQTTPNSTVHIGTSGDCGTATAYKQVDDTYYFNLTHVASYVCLLPRSPNNLVSTYVRQIKIISDNNIAGNYTLIPAGLVGNGSSNTITLTTKAASGTYEHGFLLNNSTTSQETNAAYAVIAPGQHTLTIEYTLYDNVTQTVGTITKNLPSRYYYANTVYPITANLNPKNYDGIGQYYMWDALQNYWAGYESQQPTANNTSKGTYPHSKASDPARWYNDVIFPTPASRTCINSMNVNEYIWTAMEGDPHWDDTFLWSTMGHLYKGGAWLKKIDVIAAANPGKNLQEKAPNGNNYTTYTGYWTVVSNTNIKNYRPTANLNNYYFLPAFGYYYNGVLRNVGSVGYFWSCTRVFSSENAFSIDVRPNSIFVSYNNYAYYGFRILNRNNLDVYRPI
mgnify:CR=1 FL=1